MKQTFKMGNGGREKGFEGVGGRVRVRVRKKERKKERKREKNR